jgi:hypothetical protein
MAQVSLPYTLTAGQPENVNQLQADLDALVLGVNNVNASQIDDGAVGTSELADAGVTANKLGSTLAGQLGVSQTGTDRSVTVTQTAEISTTNTTETAFVTSSELTTSANGLLRIVIFGEGKSSNASGTVTVIPQINDAGTFRTISSARGTVSAFPAFYEINASQPGVGGTSYKKFAVHTAFPFISGGVESNAAKSQFRLTYLSNNASYTAYVKNVTATMTYIAV